MADNSLTLQDFYLKLSERVTNYNANLMLRSALISSGVTAERDAQLPKEDAQAICLAMIKKGGPAFQVGKDLYQLVQ